MIYHPEGILGDEQAHSSCESIRDQTSTCHPLFAPRKLPKMHLKTVANSLALTKTNSHHDSEPPKALEPHKIATITTIEEFEQILDDHHHRRVVVFCMTTNYKDPDVSEEGWYHHYERLNDVHFVRVDLDVSLPLEERLQPRVKPCWVTFHKGEETGWSSGGMKRFVQLHSDRKHSV